MESPSKYRSNWTAFWILIAVEAFGTILLLLRIPPDPKNAILAGFSLQRLIMFSGSFLVALLFIGLAWACAKNLPFYRRGYQIFKGRWLGWIGVAGVLAAFTSTWLLFLTPPSLRGAAIERLQPYLVFVILFIVQSSFMFWRFDPEQVSSAVKVLRDDFNNRKIQPVGGWGLLMLSLVIGILSAYFTYYNLGDEGDTLTVGWLLSEGKTLYKDIFSHHFPFPYYWVGLVMRIFGPSILAARLSLVILRTLVFAGAMKITGRHLSVGLIIFAWSLIGPLYLGNMLLYDSFGALLIIPAILVTLSYAMGKTNITRPGLVFIGITVAFAGLSDPVAIIPGLILLLLLSITGVQTGNSWRERLSNSWRIVGPASVSIGVVGILFASYLLLSGSIQVFFHQAVWFNQVVYDKYASFPKAIGLLKGALNGLDILNPYWWKYPSPYYQWSSFEYLDQWVFTGLFFRFSVIFLSLVYILQGRWTIGFSIYLLASTLLWRATTAFHGQAFILFALSCAVFLMGEVISPHRSFPFFIRSDSNVKGQWHLSPYVLKMIVVFPVLVTFLWLNFRAAQFEVVNRSEYGYQGTFSNLGGNGGFYQSATCNQEDASILVYPMRMLDYFASGIPPASEYAFMFPWVADVGQQEVIAELRASKNKPILVYIYKDENIWGYPVKDYLGELIEYLDEEYIQLDEKGYVSPELATRCQEMKGQEISIWEDY